MSPTLILIPTELERKALSTDRAEVHLCGFGPIAAAARTAGLLADGAYQRVLLVGIAGTYDPAALPVGQAVCFDGVHIDPVGGGVMPQWENITDALPLARPAGVRCAGALQTVWRVGADGHGAAAEDMEGFGAAMACAMARVPLAIVRGISNAVHQRDARQWRIDEAMRAVGAVLPAALAATWETAP
ncbi:MAG: hypothetical protein GC162_03985 [Planctomycetes bacterium]|nr:hypothetical protein [Planctomycetota bacterium]